MPTTEDLRSIARNNFADNINGDISATDSRQTFLFIADLLDHLVFGSGVQATPVWTVTAATPSGATIPASAQAVIAINTTWTLWAPTTAPPGGQQTATLVRDASQRWWRLIPVEGGASPNPFLTDATAWDDSMSWDDTLQWSA